MIIDSLSVVLGLSDAQFNAGMIQAQGNLKRFSRHADRLSASMDKLGRSMTTRLSLPLAGLAAGALTVAGSFDSAMTKSLAIVKGVTPAIRQEMSSLAVDMSKKYAFSAKELADSYYFLASAGLDVNKSMSALPVVTEFAQAGMFDMASATDLLTDAYSALGPQIQKTGDLNKDMTRLSDLLVGANTLANASVQQFSEAITNGAGPAMRAFNVQVEDGLAVMAALADQGYKSNVAGSLYERFLRLLTKAVRENGEEFDKLGIKVYNSKGELRASADIIGDLTRAVGGMSTKQRGATLDMLGFEARTQQAILPLLGLSEKIANYRTELEALERTTKRVSEEQLKSFSAQLNLVKSRITAAGISMGEDLMPMALELADSIGNLADWFGQLSESERKSVIQTGAMVAAAGPMLLLMSSAIKMTSTLSKGLIWLAGKRIASASATKVETAAIAENTRAKLLNAKAGLGATKTKGMTAAGLFGRVGAVAAAGGAGYLAGRGISKLFGLDDKLAKNLWKPLMGGTELNNDLQKKTEALRAQRLERELAKKKSESAEEAKPEISAEEADLPAVTAIDTLTEALKEVADAKAEDLKATKEDKATSVLETMSVSFSALQKGSVEEYRARMQAQRNTDKVRQYQARLQEIANDVLVSIKEELAENNTETIILT